MYKLITIILMNFSILSLCGEELKVRKLYEFGKVEFQVNQPLYPVAEMIKAFIEGDIAKAKTHCTKEFVEYADKNFNDGFNNTGLKDYRDSYDKKKPLNLRFFTPVNGKVEVKVGFTTKKGSGATRYFFVINKNDTWLITTE